PESRNAEFFGLWGLASRAAAILGPVSYGIVNRVTDGNYQVALFTTLGFFIAGLVLLLTVNEKRGQLAGRSFSAE
ncbi:MAG TPA: MFS transporter, partial [Gammaproteobacteria bacterium]|nr:MFS transporter [Gammaproteobacteria bacterium]